MPSGANSSDLADLTASAHAALRWGRNLDFGAKWGETLAGFRVMSSFFFFKLMFILPNEILDFKEIVYFEKVVNDPNREKM